MAHPNKRQRAERAAAKAARRRWETEIWYPTAADLTLPYVPADEREAVRALIAPWLLNMKYPKYIVRKEDPSDRVSVEKQKCWTLAQSFVMTAQDSRVRYVEGVWKRPWQLDDPEDHPEPHA
jgi:hypothetical protein